MPAAIAHEYAEIDVLLSPAYYASDCDVSSEPVVCHEDDLKVGAGIGLGLGTPVATHVGLGFRAEVVLHSESLFAFVGLGPYVPVSANASVELLAGYGVARELPGPTQQNGIALAVRGSYRLSRHVDGSAQLAAVVYDSAPEMRYPLHAIIATLGVAFGSPVQ